MKFSWWFSTAVSWNQQIIWILNKALPRVLVGSATKYLGWNTVQWIHANRRCHRRQWQWQSIRWKIFFQSQLLKIHQRNIPGNKPVKALLRFAKLRWSLRFSVWFSIAFNIRIGLKSYLYVTYNMLHMICSVGTQFILRRFSF